ncbi:MAG: hypothetical protein A2932_00150 [Candidatus Spechtbacteria bacterium RIFCSPLOWO2_01_FULL_46_10]|uniref:Uncharacterized protein n=1 Tax=Candidatus Spechtbacteria bacterium RIFCSPLOWO2_01_FULL_46_10 TaxID=1802163 RepID=A0A1G2HFI6_9BACT|nr:MAG: hypothetical protein A2932_00150 [Candidatus Spechtbacteria bacterium RIFCSPLOWO2_01_FULL_46_10]
MEIASLTVFICTEAILFAIFLREARRSLNFRIVSRQKIRGGKIKFLKNIGVRNGGKKFKIRSPGRESRVIAIFGFIPGYEHREFEKLAYLLKRKKERAPQLPIIIFLRGPGGFLYGMERLCAILLEADARYLLITDFAASATADIFSFLRPNGFSVMTHDAWLMFHLTEFLPATPASVRKIFDFRYRRERAEQLRRLDAVLFRALLYRIQSRGTLEEWQKILGLNKGVCEEKYIEALIRYFKKDTYIDAICAFELGLTNQVVVTRSERKELIRKASLQEHSGNIKSAACAAKERWER